MDIARLYHQFLKSSGVCTDTRQIYSNCLFFALKGENFNGNLFAQEALDQGARMAVVDDEAHHTSTGETFLVQNSLLALQELALFHRNKIKTTIIALTGSNGKTTTKELINAVLSQRFRTVATKGNFNNHIGVPLTLLSITPETEFGIVEMGANHLGEIEILSEIAQPDFGYITNFGKAHLEGFGSLEGVVKGKSELYAFLKENNKKIFINADDPKQMEVSRDIQRITFGTSSNNFNIELLDSSDTLVLKFNGTKIQSNLVGAYNFVNISAAIAIGAYFKVPTTEIKKGIESYTPSNNRSQLIKKHTNTILLDAYNANPSSMIAALENFKQVAGKNKILILGDMFELGSDAAAEHQNIVNFVSTNYMGKVFLVGENFYKTDIEAHHIHKFRTFEELKKEVLNQPPSEATILLKASRGMALERILEIL